MILRVLPTCCRGTTFSWDWLTPVRTSVSYATPASRTDLLGSWVRERQIMSLEQAVHKLTAEPARVYGLTGRGLVEVGMAADLVVFDPETVAPGPLRRVVDFPAEGERLTADAPVG